MPGSPREHRREVFGGPLAPLAVMCAALAVAAHPAAVQTDNPPTQLTSAETLAAAHRAFLRGRFDEAERYAQALDAGRPEVAVLRGRLAAARGRYADAERLLAPAASMAPHGEAALELGLLQTMLGRRADANRTLTAIVQGWPRPDAPADYVRAARAARALGAFQEANDYFRAAATRAPDDVQVNVAWGELFLEKHNRQEAARSFQAALRADPSFAPAHIGLARAVMDENPPAAASAAERALAINPASVDAHLLLAELALDQGHGDRARDAVARALEVNPSSLPAHALQAAISHLEGNSADFQAAVDRALAVNPSYGDVHRVSGDLAARQYRFDEAVALVRRAIALDQGNPRAYADLGVHLLRAGDEEEARQVLERAFRADPYDVVAYNLLGLLDTLDTFVTIEADSLRVRLHPDEAPVLREYVVPLALEALRRLSARYEFAPRGPVLVEVFPRHDDFAVRNVGLPGMIGALGACFGRVVTMDSPRARPPGTFNWGATLWHEMAHVVTLQLSRQRVPRWLSEGISVYEERLARPEWGRDMAIAFAEALDRGDVLKLRDLNAGFTNPETISLAYYQASLVAEYLVSSYGLPAVRRLLVAYGDGLDTDAAFQRALDLDVDRLQRQFDAWVASAFDELRRALKAPQVPPTSDPAKLRAIAAEHPGSYPVQHGVALALRRAGDLDGAMAALERAAALVPMATGKDSPRALMADIAVERGDAARAMRELEQLLQHDHSDVEAARRLATLAEAAGDKRLVVLGYERVVAIDPFDGKAHVTLGRLALRRPDLDTATRELRAALALGPADPAAVHCDLAEAYLLSGRRADARRQALAALEIAPRYERAQELLLKATEAVR